MQSVKNQALFSFESLAQFLLITRGKKILVPSNLGGIDMRSFFSLFVIGILFG
jgi:hypothetical protein